VKQVISCTLLSYSYKKLIKT